MRNIISDGTYIYVTFRSAIGPTQTYHLQKRLASDGSIGVGCWDVDLSSYSYFIGISSICSDGSFIYTCSSDPGISSIVSKFDTLDGSNVWSFSYSTTYLKVREYGSYVYACGQSNSSGNPLIDQIDKSDGSIFYSFEGSPTFSQVTALDIDSNGLFVSFWFPTDYATVSSSIIYKLINFSWTEVWSTTIFAPPPNIGLGIFNDIKTEELKVNSTNVISVGYETDLDPNGYSRGRRDTIDKTDGTVTDTKFWPNTTYHSTMKGVDIQSGEIFTGGYRTVTIGDPNYDPENTKWVMTRGSPTIT